MDAVAIVTSVTGAGAMARTGDVLVYQSLNEAGETQYVGITNSILRRAREHLMGKGIEIEPIPGLGNLSRQDAKAVEQVLIEVHGLGKNGGTLLNKINAISSRNPGYVAGLRRGTELLERAGYRFF